MAKLTWLGDEDPSQQSVDMFGLTFVKGEARDVPKDFPHRAKLEGNPMFSSDGKAEAIVSEEPEQPDPEAGTERAALRADLDDLGVKYDARASVETLRGALAKALAKDG